MKKFSKILCLVLVVVMMAGLCVVGTNAAYTDADKITYTEAVDVMSAIGVLQGDDRGFRPADGLTRAEACKIIAYMVGAEKMTASSTFKDTKGHWAENFIAYCAAEGFVNGVGDNKFDPDAALTGSAFAKMLLGALGYDAAAAGMTGDTWEVGVAKLIKATALTTGVTTFDGSKAISREIAAQMGFNALQTTMVGYAQGGTTITSGDITITTGASQATNKLAIAGRDYNNAVGDSKEATCELAEAYFPTLKLTTTTSGSFARPATVWQFTPKNSTVQTITATKVATKTYTTAVTAKTIYADLGLVDATVTPTYYLNGTSGQVTSTSSAVALTRTATDKIGANGVVTEVYVTNDTLGSQAVTICQTKYTLGVVANVASYKATSAKGAYTTYTIDTVSVDANNAYVDASSVGATVNIFSSVVNKTNDVDNGVLNGTFAKKDYVLFAQDASASNKTYVYPVTTATGALTASSASGYTIGGTVYPSANVTVAGGAASFNTALYGAKGSVTVAIDAYGNVIAPIAGTASEAKYVYVAHQKLSTSLVNDELVYTVTAYVVDTDGAIKTMSVSKVGSSTNFNSSTVPGTVLPDGLYTYKLAKNGTTYELTTAGNALSGASFNYATGATISGSVVGNANTVFYTIKIDGNTTSTTYNQPISVTTTTGMAAMGNMTGVNGAYVATPNNVATYVFNVGGSAVAAAKVAYYLGTYSYDGTDYYYDVIVDGAVTTLKNPTGAITTAATKGLYTVNASNVATACTTPDTDYSDFTATYYNTLNTYGLTNNGGLLNVVETVISTGVATTTNNVATIKDTTPVYIISAEAGTCTTSTGAELAISGATQIYVNSNRTSSPDAIGAIYAVVD